MNEVNPNDYIDGNAPPLPDTDIEPVFTLTNEQVASMTAYACSTGAPAGKDDVFREQFVKAVLPAFEMADIAGALTEMGVETLDPTELPGWVRLLGAGAWAAFMFVSIRKGLRDVPVDYSGSGNGVADSAAAQQQQQQQPAPVDTVSPVNTFPWDSDATSDTTE